MSNNFCMLLILGLFAAPLSWAGETSKVEEMTFDLTSSGKVTLVANEGTIRVRGWERQKVHLQITRRVWAGERERAEELLERLEVRVEHSDDRLYVRTVDSHDENRFILIDIFDSSRWRGHSGHQVDFDLTVPTGIALDLKGDEGDIEVSGVEGEVAIAVDEGDVSLSQMKDVELDLEVDEGNVEVQHVLGDASRISIRADEGGIRMLDCRLQQLTVETDEGDVILDEVKAQDCLISSDEGDLEARLDVLSKGTCGFSTEEGDIFLSLSDRSNLLLAMETEDGRIRSELPFDIQKLGAYGEKLKGVFGDGLARLSVTTEEGNITLERD